MTTLTSLSSLQAGDEAIIQALHVEEGFLHRLNGLGLRIGRSFEIIRCAPFNGPLHIRIGSTELMLRRQDAALIEVRL